MRHLSCLFILCALPRAACGGSDDGIGDGTAAPTCADDQRNGAETDTDCGGGTCEPCDGAKACGVADDCRSSVCTDAPASSAGL